MFQEKLYKKLKQGFTLVELLIVMGILAILSAMGFRYYTSNIVTSRDASRIQTLTSMH